MEPARGRSAVGVVALLATMAVPADLSVCSEARGLRRRRRSCPPRRLHPGLTSFLILNGQVPCSGPVQLLAPQPPAGDAVRAGHLPPRRGALGKTKSCHGPAVNNKRDGKQPSARE